VSDQDFAYCTQLPRWRWGWARPASVVSAIINQTGVWCQPCGPLICARVLCPVFPAGGVLHLASLGLHAPQAIGAGDHQGPHSSHALDNLWVGHLGARSYPLPASWLSHPWHGGSLTIFWVVYPILSASVTAPMVLGSPEYYLFTIMNTILGTVSDCMPACLRGGITGGYMAAEDRRAHRCGTMLMSSYHVCQVWPIYIFFYAAKWADNLEDLDREEEDDLDRLEGLSALPESGIMSIISEGCVPATWEASRGAEDVLSMVPPPPFAWVLVTGSSVR
jgi:hypothetical protein